MGFDLKGAQPVNDKGEYFRNNISWWWPLWKYVYEACKDILTEEDFRNGYFNDGHFIDNDKAKKIATRLEHLLNQGEIEKLIKVLHSTLESRPDEVCGCCHGTGKIKCTRCGGVGKVKPSMDGYPFSEENIKNFAEFCKNSGGFDIW